MKRVQSIKSDAFAWTLKQHHLIALRGDFIDRRRLGERGRRECDDKQPRRDQRKKRCGGDGPCPETHRHSKSD
ncbi:hypothetical protein C2E31_16860 [Rhodopirellula baltica]|nr:hypothetical protein C2E31_16860 [Rhodopirellula baltica]